MVTDMITNDEMSRAGLANDLLEVELLNEEGYEDADGGPVRETHTHSLRLPGALDSSVFSYVFAYLSVVCLAGAGVHVPGAVRQGHRA